MPEKNGHIANGFSSLDPARTVKNLDYFPCQLLEIDLRSNSHRPQMSFPTASRHETFEGDYTCTCPLIHNLTYFLTNHMHIFFHVNYPEQNLKLRKPSSVSQ